MKRQQDSTFKMKKTTAEQEVSLCFHIICLILNYFTVTHDLDSKFAWFTFQRYAGKWKYMSHLILYANTVYILYAIIVDVLNILGGYSGRPNEERPFFVRIRDIIFNEITFPFGIGHSVIFILTTLLNQGFFVSAINRRKEDLKSYHMMYLHVFPLIFCLLESALVYHKRSKKEAFKAPLALALLYDAWILWVVYSGGYWSYPFLRRATNIVRMLCMILLPVIIIGCHSFGEKVTRYFWAVETLPETEVEREKKQD